MKSVEIYGVGSSYLPGRRILVPNLGSTYDVILAAAARFRRT